MAGFWFPVGCWDPPTLEASSVHLVWWPSTLVDPAPWICSVWIVEHHPPSVEAKIPICMPAASYEVIR